MSAPFSYNASVKRQQITAEDERGRVTKMKKSEAGGEVENLSFNRVRNENFLLWYVWLQFVNRITFLWALLSKHAHGNLYTRTSICMRSIFILTDF